MKGPRIEGVLRRALRDLDAAGVRFALVGGLAVSARTEPRFTRDIDLAVSVSGDAEAERLVKSLREKGYETVSIVEQEAAGRLATARLVPPGEKPGGVILDILFASSGVEPEIVDSSERIRISAGIEVEVATIGHLIATKVLCRDDAERPQDRVDLIALLKAAGDEDLRRARDLLGLIRDRGFHRGKDLFAGLEAIAKEARRGG